MKHVKFILIVLCLITTQFLFAQQKGEYYFSKKVKGSFEEVTNNVKSALKEQGFGVITEIDMDKKLKEKLTDIDVKPYKILGVCNPKFAYETLQEEENIGLFLPCKALVKDIGNGNIEVVIVNPSALMKMSGNNKLEKIAAKVEEKFLKAIKNI